MGFQVTRFMVTELVASALILLILPAVAMHMRKSHVTRGGLGTMVAEALFDADVVKPLTRIGLPDKFIECGVVSSLQDRYGISTRHLVEAGAQATRRS